MSKQQNESAALRSKFSSTKISSKSRTFPKVFTEKGLYMLATILKSKVALGATFAIIETFAQVRGLKKELVDLHKETDPEKQTAIAKLKIYFDRFFDISDGIFEI